MNDSSKTAAPLNSHQFYSTIIASTNFLSCGSSASVGVHLLVAGSINGNIEKSLYSQGVEIPNIAASANKLFYTRGHLGFICRFL